MPRRLYIKAFNPNVIPQDKTRKQTILQHVSQRFKNVVNVNFILVSLTCAFDECELSN